jgi:hypothetical protein
MRMFYPQDSGGKPLNVPNGALKKLEGSIWEKQLAKNSRPPAKYDVHLQSSSQLSNEETIGSPSRVLEPRWVPIFFSIPRWVSTTRGRGISRVAPIGTSLGLDVVLPLKSDSRDSWHIRREHNNYDVLDIYIYIHTSYLDDIHVCICHICTIYILGCNSWRELTCTASSWYGLEGHQTHLLRNACPVLLANCWFTS